MPNAIHLTSHIVARSKNESAPDAADWSFQAEPAVDSKYWVTDNGSIREMTTAEKDANVATWIADHLTALIDEMVRVGTAYASETTQDWIRVEHLKATLEGRTAAVAYLQPAIDYDKAISDHYKEKRDTILAATTHDAVYAVTWDFESITVPAKVSVADARQMGAA